MILVCHVISEGLRVLEFYGWELLMVGHQPAKFSDHRHCSSVDVH